MRRESILYILILFKNFLFPIPPEGSEAERELSLNLPTNDDELFEEGFNDIDETDTLLLAEKMSMNPELLIGMDEQRCVIADILKE